MGYGKMHLQWLMLWINSHTLILWKYDVVPSSYNFFLKLNLLSVWTRMETTGNDALESLGEEKAYCSYLGNSCLDWTEIWKTERSMGLHVVLLYILPLAQSSN